MDLSPLIRFYDYVLLDLSNLFDMVVLAHAESILISVLLWDFH